MFRRKNKPLEVNIDRSPDNLLTDTGWLIEGNEGQLLLDVYQDDRNIYIKSTISGVKPEDVEISLHNDMLTIRGVRRREEEIDQKDYFYQECYWGGFSRSIILPFEVKADQIAANLKSGVLTIILPKAENKRNIPIQISED